MKNKWDLLKETIQYHKEWNEAYYKKTGHEGARDIAEEDGVILFLMERLEEHEKHMKKLEEEG